jgi:hypothetical protein
VTSVCFADSDPDGPIPPTADAADDRQLVQTIMPLSWEGDVEGDVAPSLSHLGCSPSSREPLPAEHRARHRDDSDGRTKNMTMIGQHVVTRKWRLSAGVAMAAVALAGCGSAAAVRTASSPSTTSAPKEAGATSTSAVGSGGSVATVLSSWESAQQTLYGYLQAPWQQDRANLVAGESAATLWPNLANYFADPALKSEETFLVGVKIGQLNGPTSFDLGTPKVSALTPTTATVVGCLSDTGTTTTTGTPGPPTLGGGAGHASGTWDLELIGGTWKVGTFQTTTVPKC